MKRSERVRGVETTVILMVLCLVVGLLVPGAALAKKKKGLATFQGNIMSISGGGARGTILTIRIDRWSTEEERQELLETIKSNKRNPTAAQSRALPDALRDQDKAGLVSVTGGMGYPLRYTAKYEQDGKTLIILAMNRQIAFSEAGRSSQSMDYNVSVVALTVDDEGNGTGVVSVATELLWNEDKQQIEPTVIDSQPARMENVKKIK